MCTQNCKHLNHRNLQHVLLCNLACQQGVSVDGTENHQANNAGRNPAPVDMVDLSLFTEFYTSQVVQDFLHQQYVYSYSEQKITHTFIAREINHMIT